MGGVRTILARPSVYELWSSLVGARNGRSTLVREYARPVEGARVLDLGCGPGELVRHLGEVDYVGVDMSEEYIAAAKRLFGKQGDFRIGDATRLDASLEDFDLVLAFGVLHHLSDGEAESLLRGAARALGKGGRFVSVDPTFVPRQSRAARFLVSKDRGEHVRVPDAYEALAARVFANVRRAVRTDLLRIPYTHCVLECD